VFFFFFFESHFWFIRALATCGFFGQHTLETLFITHEQLEHTFTKLRKKNQKKKGFSKKEKHISTQKKKPPKK